MASGIKKVARNWRQLPSGIWVPDGDHSERSQGESYTFLSIKDKAVELEFLAAEIGFEINRACDLAALIRNAKDVSDSWISGRWDELTMPKLYDSAHFSRIADALLPLSGTPDLERYLEKLASGRLELFARDHSVAKDYLWEAELFSILRRKFIDAEFREPDIVANFEGEELGIACKKIHSEKNVEKVFSKGVSQIEAGFECGIVAFNIDDLLPKGYVIKANNQDEAGRLINQINLKFLGHHERHFRKYLASGRVLSAFVSTCVLVETPEGASKLNNQRQSTLWMIPGLDEDKKAMSTKLYNQIMQ